MEGFGMAIENVIPIISNIHFVPMKRHESFIGFVSFILEIPSDEGKEDYKFSFKSVAVHELLDKSGIRLVFPKDEIYDRTYIYPINKTTHELIQNAISDFFYKSYNIGIDGEVEQNFNRS
jgi:hypothetical protein